MTEEALNIETDDDFSTEEAPAHEILYDDDKPVEVEEPEAPAGDDEPDELPPAAGDEDPYVKARRDVETETKIKTTVNAFAQDLLTVGKAVGIDPNQAAAYMKAGRTAEVIAAVKEQGRAAIDALDVDKAKKVLLKSELRERVESLQQTAGQLQAVGQHYESQAHERGRAKLVKECPKLAQESEAIAFQDYLVKVRKHTVKEIAACKDHRILADAYAGFEKWRGQRQKVVIPKHGRKKVKVRQPGDTTDEWKPGDPLSKLREIGKQRLKSGEMSTEALFAANGEPRAQTNIYGLPKRKSEAPRKRLAADDPVTILYGSS